MKIETNVPYKDWTQESPNSLSIKWDNSINMKRSIWWRGILFYISIQGNDSAHGTGHGRTVKFYYKNKLFTCYFWKWKWLGGCTDHMKPVINCDTHELKITMQLKSLCFTDISLNQGNASSQFLENPFQILATPSEIFDDESLIKKP